MALCILWPSPLAEAKRSAAGAGLTNFSELYLVRRRAPATARRASHIGHEAICCGFLKVSFFEFAEVETRLNLLLTCIALAQFSFLKIQGLVVSLVGWRAGLIAHVMKSSLRDEAAPVEERARCLSSQDCLRQSDHVLVETRLPLKRFESPLAFFYYQD